MVVQIAKKESVVEDRVWRCIDLGVRWYTGVRIVFVVHRAARVCIHTCKCSV